MKKPLLTSLFILSFSAVTFAAPMTDYSTEKVAVDIACQPNLNFGCDADFDGKTKNIDFGITVALDKKWGVQYVRNNPKMDTIHNSIISGNQTLNYSVDGNLKVDQYNLTYNSSKNTVLFLGVTKHKVEASSNYSYGNEHGFLTASSKSVTGTHIGAMQVIPIDKGLNSYGIMSIGTKLFNVELGLSQQLSKNVDLNLFYKYMKCTDVGDSDLDISSQGLGFGATFKF